MLHDYGRLLVHKPSPVVAPNCAVALAYVAGPLVAIQTVLALDGLANNHYYHAILGYLYQQNGEPNLASDHFAWACQLTSSTAEKELLTRKKNNGTLRPYRD